MSDEARIREELERVQEAICVMTGLPSRWSGNVVLVDGAFYKGRKKWRCDIEINTNQIALDERWATHIHEMLHAVSVGVNPSDFQTHPGWEEGVVEQLQRLLRPAILQQLNVTVLPEVFLSDESFHPYNLYIAPLEDLRQALHMAEEDFYYLLLRTPFLNRPGKIYGLARTLPTEEWIEFRRIFAEARTMLEV